MSTTPRQLICTCGSEPEERDPNCEVHTRAGSGEHSDQGGVESGPSSQFTRKEGDGVPNVLDLIRAKHDPRDIIGENIRNGITADGSHYTCFQKPDMAQYEVYPDGTVVVLIKQNGVRHLFEIPPTLHTNDASADGSRGASTEIQSVPDSAGQSDTPETDAKAASLLGLMMIDYAVGMEAHARTLERQRDEARAERDQFSLQAKLAIESAEILGALREKLTDDIAPVTAQRDAALAKLNSRVND